MGGKNAVIGSDVDYVMVYFSAHWCPPCIGFTPKLADYYNSNSSSKKFEIVFVSADQDEKSMKEYFATMPWLAVKYSDRKTEQTLSQTYGVSGIPMLVVLNAKTGEVVTKEGRSGVMNKPDGFPWAK